MRYSNEIRLIYLIIGLSSWFQLAACKGEEKASQLSQEIGVAEMKDIEPAGLCPQTRGTAPAPEPYAGMTNILPARERNIAAGKQLFYRLQFYRRHNS